MTDPTTFICGLCGNTFDKEWSDEEAAAEELAVFGQVHQADDAEVCDDCFELVKP